MTEPAITIVTINRNTGDTVLRTIESVRAQRHPFTWVVVDGASSDQSLGHLRQGMRSHDRLVSEADSGIADAFNKGICLASGDAILFMNAGDEFADPDALGQLAQSWDRQRYGWITGGAEIRDEGNRLLYGRCHDPGTDGRALLGRGCRIWHAATLIDRRLFDRYGLFDTTYRIAMDYEMWLRFLVAGEQPQVIDKVVARFRIGGISAQVMRRFREDQRARGAHGMLNPPWTERKLAFTAWIKDGLRHIATPGLYRIKEWMRV